MQAIRHFLTQHHLVALICAAALSLKLLVPTGYMVASERGRITIMLCSGTGPATMTMDMAGMHGDADSGKSKEHGKAEMPCAFSGLSAAALGAVDPVVLLELIAFVLALGFAPTINSRLEPLVWLRPPLRGPPSTL